MVIKIRLFLVILSMYSTLCFADEKRLEVLPVFFVPKDNTDITEQLMEEYSELLYSHLVLAREHYKSLLETDTFIISAGKFKVYYSKKTDSYYTSLPINDGPDTAHAILKELFDWSQDNRIDSKYIYLVIYVRPNKERGTGPFLGGGRTFNGIPNSGGGYLELELSSLISDKPYPFQSTLVHELGHSFGLTHVNCYGYDMSENSSIMSYNLSHHSKGLIQSETPGNFNPEEYYILSQNKLDFPDFQYSEEKHNQQGKEFVDIDVCYLGRMSDYIGKIRRLPGVGYELFFNGKLVSGPEAAFYSKKQALENCKWNRDRHENIEIECRYNGKPIEIE